MMDGVLLIDKPSGPTSFDVVRQVKRRFQMKKVGHAGTLDPLASGLLIVCLGQGTKLVPYLMDGAKQYDVTVTLGTLTDTLDSDGEVVKQADIPLFTHDDVVAASEAFVGNILQVPPIYSALKKGGEALYKKARRGETVELEPRPVRIDRISVVQVDGIRFSLRVDCGKGTYIRSLARDMAEAIGTVGHVSQLRRIASSGFDVQDAHLLDRLADEKWDDAASTLSLAKAVAPLPSYSLSDDEAVAVGFGKTIRCRPEGLLDPGADGPIAMVKDTVLLAMATRTPKGELKILRGFAQH